MPPRHRIAYLPGIVILSLAVLSCNFNLPGFLPTPTPTASQTNTATLTPSSTATFTSTPTPKPPLRISGCLLENECPGVNQISNYFPEDLERFTNTNYQVSVPFEDRVRFYYGWCTIDSATLNDNMENIEFVFEIDGVSYINDASVGYTTNSYDDDPSAIYPCYSIAGVLSGWKKGESHQVIIGMRILNEINDGWDTYSPSEMFYIYTVIPTDRPTPTPTATRTKTPPPLPTVPFYTATPKCEASSSISITNSTGSIVTLYLSGPSNYYYELATGDTTLYVCPGTYNYTAYGCGGATDSGSMTTGESHEFYCQ